MLTLQILIDGFAISALYALGATGFTLIFGVSGVLNLSHGAIMVLAAVAAWAAASVLHVNTYAGALIGVAVALVAAFATYFAVVQPIQKSRRIPNEEKEIFVLTGTLLWGIMIQELIAYFFTNNAKTVLPIVEGVVNILGVRTPRNEIFTAVVCCLVIGLLWLLVNRTRTGKAVLAASMNPRGVTLLGLELTSIYVVVWAIYGILAGIAGVLLGMFLGVSSYSVGPLTASAFSIVVLGGLGSVSGSLIAAFVVGYLETADGLSDFAGLPDHSGAAAAGRRDVYPAARPAREAMSMADFFKSRLFFVSLAIVIIASTLPLYVSGYILGLLTVAYYFGVFAMSWDLLFGFAGEVNFGPTFLIGVGAYTAGILNNQYGWSVYLCIVLGALASVIAGFVLALPALRVRGPYFGLTTLVAVLMLQNFIVVFADLTGGEIGLTIPDVITINANANYWIALGFMTISAAILYGLSQSPIGLVLQASGQDPVQAGALGFNIVKHKLAAFIVSAFFSGLSGALLVFYFGTASVGTVVDIAVGVNVIVAAVLGGRRTVLGAALGAIFLIVAGEFLRPTGELATFIVSAVALLVVLFFPGGFLGAALSREARS